MPAFPTLHIRVQRLDCNVPCTNHYLDSSAHSKLSLLKQMLTNCKAQTAVVVHSAEDVVTPYLLFLPLLNILPVLLFLISASLQPNHSYLYFSPTTSLLLKLC